MERVERAVLGAGGRAGFAAHALRAGWAAAFVAWIAAVAAGFAILQRYKSTPGDQERPPARWPGESRIALDAQRPTLVMFAHPRCPCTSASISELARLLATAGDAVRAHVVVLRPHDAGTDWDHAALWSRASRIPGVAVVRDEDGAEAARFHAYTSGLVVLYSARGQRLFAGGITASRGHEGDSFGRRRILALLEGRPADKDESPVFGCALRSREEAR
jgi:hypothetical protein